jgi:hypothetical protein
LFEFSNAIVIENRLVHKESRNLQTLTGRNRHSCSISAECVLCMLKEDKDVKIATYNACAVLGY